MRMIKKISPQKKKATFNNFYLKINKNYKW